MKKVIATLFASSILLASVPAFACGGDKTAEKSDHDTVMTSADESTEEAKGDETKKAKKAKKDTSEEKADGEV